ncbi:MAG: helix-turn-helix transcriptional regulator [Clostridia bacterium]|nr:helix-turn-helix transcriptional regulator [Clostridia bacterium]
MKFGENFKRIRLQCNLSQKDVAKKLKLNQSNVSNWEKDKSRPEYENLIELSRLYNVSLYELLGIDEY